MPGKSAERNSHAPARDIGKKEMVNVLPLQQTFSVSGVRREMVSSIVRARGGIGSQIDSRRRAPSLCVRASTAVAIPTPYTKVVSILSFLVG
jgi:hypothetical protein